MSDRASSVLARLKKESARNGRGFQLTLQLFCQEELLRRIAQSRFAGNVLVDAFRRTFANRGHNFVMTDLDSVLLLKNDFAIQTRWKAFEKKVGVMEGGLSRLLREIEGFVRSPLDAAFVDATFNFEWTPNNGCWKDGKGRT